jgi:hypothetical protein
VTNPNYPETVEAAVRLLKVEVSDREQEKIRAMVEGDLTMLHFGLGQWIRNHLGLWGGNSALITDTGEQSVDDASDVIIRAFWSALRAELPKIH